MPRIIIIEDEKPIADTSCYALESEGFQVDWSPTLKSGQAKINEQNYDLLILDVGLPDGNGFDFCRELRKHSNIPIIFLTARSEEVDRIVGLELGADDYMVKPFSPRELSARVRALLRRQNQASMQQASGISKIPFEINEAKFQIFYHGKLLELSRYEFLLLKIFIERPERIFSRDQLMNLAWGNAETSLDRTVDAHIKTLRAKLKAIDPEKDPIETHRGLGYSFKNLTPS